MATSKDSHQSAYPQPSNAGFFRPTNPSEQNPVELSDIPCTEGRGVGNPKQKEDKPDEGTLDMNEIYEEMLKIPGRRGTRLVDCYIAILQRDVQEWNQWRQEHPATRPELVEAQLSGMNLHGANLSTANLSKANLSAANLSMSDLSNADLSSADLRRADLTGANLRGADLSGADLRWANLDGANLQGANLSEEFRVAEPPPMSEERVAQDEEEPTEATTSPNDQTSFTKTKAATSTKVPASQAPHKSVAQAQNHLTILQQGVQAWNRWRQEHPATRPELVGAQLSGVKLQGAHLQRANLSRANLSMADLSNADLSGADLRWANLTGANLQGANLSNAFLTNARLIDTTLTNTQLRNSDLRGALFDNTSFTGAALNGAYLYRTVFGDVDLSAAQGLEHVKHWGPSLLGMEAIARSKGSLPVAFLRGVGVPDSLLPHIHSLLSTVTCFISYAHEDMAFVKSLEADLQPSGVRCWLDPEHKKKGEICSRVDDKLLIVLSTHSCTSAWLQEEIEFVLQRQAQLGKRLLFLLRLDHATMPTSGSWDYYTLDFTPWQDPRIYHEALSQLLRELKA